MHAQLEAVAKELETARHRLHELARDFGEDEWSRPPAGGGWSANECIAHLNLTSRAFIPLVDEGLARARALGGGLPPRIRRDPLGWLIWKSVQPDGGMKVSTRPRFVPTAEVDRAAVIEEFDELQDEIVSRVRAANGLPIHRVKIASPFEERLRYSIYSAFTVLASHEHRHINQAERALRSTRA